MPQLQLGRLLIGSIIAAFIGITGVAVAPSLAPERTIDISIEPQFGTYTVEDTFVVSVMVRSNEPVNVFSGHITFDPAVLSVERIDYNTSIADLWAVEPWYANGDGSLGFAGGTTMPGGFTGEGALLTITFKAQGSGSGSLHLSDERILKHDGLGTEAHMTHAAIDAIFTIEPDILAQETVAKEGVQKNTITILDEGHALDLNADGMDSIADMSIFMVHMSTQNPRSDFNRDGLVGMSDLSILLAGI